MEPISPNESPSREEYGALFQVLLLAQDLLDAMGARAAESCRYEYRALSHAVARARVENRKASDIEQLADT
jgi:hypothetical protein